MQDTRDLSGGSEVDVTDVIPCLQTQDQVYFSVQNSRHNVSILSAEIADFTTLWELVLL